MKHRFPKVWCATHRTMEFADKKCTYRFDGVDPGLMAQALAKTGETMPPAERADFVQFLKVRTPPKPLPPIYDFKTGVGGALKRRQRDAKGRWVRS